MKATIDLPDDAIRDILISDRDMLIKDNEGIEKRKNPASYEKEDEMHNSRIIKAINLLLSEWF